MAGSAVVVSLPLPHRLVPNRRFGAPAVAVWSQTAGPRRAVGYRPASLAVDAPSMASVPEATGATRMATRTRGTDVASGAEGGATP